MTTFYLPRERKFFSGHTRLLLFLFTVLDTLGGENLFTESLLLVHQVVLETNQLILIQSYFQL